MNKYSKLDDSFINETNINECKIAKPIIDDCYICLEPITHTNPAMFIYKCKHAICIDCLAILGKSKTRKCLGEQSKCGICRASSNMYVINSNEFTTFQYNPQQSLHVPSQLIEIENNTIFNDPHFDVLQKIITKGYSKK